MFFWSDSARVREEIHRFLAKDEGGNNNQMKQMSRLLTFHMSYRHKVADKIATLLAAASNR